MRDLELSELARLRDERRERFSRDARDLRDQAEYRAMAKPAEVLYIQHDPKERLDEHRPTWRIRGGHYLKPKIATKDLSKLDLSAQAAKNIDLSREGVTAALGHAVNGLPQDLVLGLRSAVLKERRVLTARRRELLGDVDEERLGAIEVRALSALERALVAEYGFLPRFQLRWVGTI